MSTPSNAGGDAAATRNDPDAIKADIATVKQGMSR